MIHTTPTPEPINPLDPAPTFYTPKGFWERVLEMKREQDKKKVKSLIN